MPFEVPTLAVAAVVGLLLVIKSFEVLRSQPQFGRPLELGGFWPQAVLQRVLMGGATETLPALALEVEIHGVARDYTPGYLPLTILTHWIPGGMWRDKLPSSADLLHSRCFPDHNAPVKANSEFSIHGDFYYDFGLPSVVAGMVVLGIASQGIAGVLTAASGSGAGPVLYAPFLRLLVVLQRGDAALTAGLALFIYLPFVAATVFSPRSPRGETRPPDALLTRVWAR